MYPGGMNMHQFSFKLVMYTTIVLYKLVVLLSLLLLFLLVQIALRLSYRNIYPLIHHALSSASPLDLLVQPEVVLVAPINCYCSSPECADDSFECSSQNECFAEWEAELPDVVTYNIPNFLLKNHYGYPISCNNVTWFGAGGLEFASVNKTSNQFKDLMKIGDGEFPVLKIQSPSSRYAARLTQAYYCCAEIMCDMRKRASNATVEVKVVNTK